MNLCTRYKHDGWSPHTYLFMYYITEIRQYFCELSKAIYKFDVIKILFCLIFKVLCFGPEKHRLVYVYRASIL